MDLVKIVSTVREIRLHKPVTVSDERAHKKCFWSVEESFQVQHSGGTARQDAGVPPGFIPLQVAFETVMGMFMPGILSPPLEL
jgi:hypothetical protein